MASQHEKPGFFVQSRVPDIVSKLSIHSSLREIEILTSGTS
jgi:hypothetical protein